MERLFPSAYYGEKKVGEYFMKSDNLNPTQGLCGMKCDYFKLYDLFFLFSQYFLS